MAAGKLGPHPSAALGGGHDLTGDRSVLGIVDLCLFFTAADVFAVRGVVGHQWPLLNGLRSTSTT